MTPQRVQMGRNGPQFSFTRHAGVVCVLDHDIGCSVTTGAQRVCEFVWQHIEGLPKDGFIVYRDTQKKWDIMVVIDGRFDRFLPGGYIGSVLNADAAFGLGPQAHESQSERCAS